MLSSLRDFVDAIKRVYKPVEFVELFVSVDNKMGEPQEEKRFSSDDDSVDYEAESEENSDDDDDISIEECEINDKSTSVNTAQGILEIK